jgi:hypothetical protein
VNDEFEPLEERLKSQIVRLIEEAQNRAFSSYRAMQNSTEAHLSLPHVGESNPNPESVLATFYEPTPLQVQSHSTLSFQYFGVPLRRNETLSDSGYASNQSTQSGIGSSFQTSSQLEVTNTSTYRPINDRHVDAELVNSSSEPKAMLDDFSDSLWENTNNTDMEEYKWDDSWIEGIEGTEEDLEILQ